MPRVLLTERSQQPHPEPILQPADRVADAGEMPMVPFLVDRNWYQRYWWGESSDSVQAPLLRALIGIAGKRILCMFRPMRNGGSASVDAGVPSSRGDTDR